MRSSQLLESWKNKDQGMFCLTPTFATDFTASAAPRWVFAKPHLCHIPRVCPFVLGEQCPQAFPYFSKALIGANGAPSPPAPAVCGLAAEWTSLVVLSEKLDHWHLKTNPIPHQQDHSKDSEWVEAYLRDLSVRGKSDVGGPKLPLQPETLAVGL